MGLLETIMIGSYMYTTGVFLWFQRKYERLRDNHLKHTEVALNEVRERVGLPPVSLTDGDR